MRVDPDFQKKHIFHFKAFSPLFTLLLEWLEQKVLELIE